MFEFIDTHRGEFRLDVMSRMLGVTKSGYFAWLGRPISTRKTQDEALKAEIVKIHADSKGRYGALRVQAELREAGMPCSRRRVERQMREAGLYGKARRKYKKTTQADPTVLPAPELPLRRHQGHG